MSLDFRFCTPLLGDRHICSQNFFVQNSILNNFYLKLFLISHVFLAALSAKVNYLILTYFFDFWDSYKAQGIWRHNIYIFLHPTLVHLRIIEEALLLHKAFKKLTEDHSETFKFYSNMKFLKNTTFYNIGQFYRYDTWLKTNAKKFLCKKTALAHHIFSSWAVQYIPVNCQQKLYDCVLSHLRTLVRIRKLHRVQEPICEHDVHIISTYK